LKIYGFTGIILSILKIETNADVSSHFGIYISPEFIFVDYAAGSWETKKTA